VLRTQRGNNNAYCQDNETSWFPWDLVEQNRDMLTFCRCLINLRKKSELFRQCAFFSGKRTAGLDIPDIGWYGADLNPPIWEGANNRLLCSELKLLENDSGFIKRSFSLFMIFNMEEQQRVVSLPQRPGLIWHLLCDTGYEEGKLFTQKDSKSQLNPQHQYCSLPRTVIMLVSAHI
jgi:glycogen operon protein